MADNVETRVGYSTINILKDELENYCSLFTLDGKYKGKLEYLQLYYQYDKYLNS